MRWMVIFKQLSPSACNPITTGVAEVLADDYEGALEKAREDERYNKADTVTIGLLE